MLSNKNRNQQQLRSMLFSKKRTNISQFQHFSQQQVAVFHSLSILSLATSKSWEAIFSVFYDFIWFYMYFFHFLPTSAISNWFPGHPWALFLGRLLTIFSASHYAGRFSNSGGVAVLQRSGSQSSEPSLSMRCLGGGYPGRFLKMQDPHGSPSPHWLANGCNTWSNDLDGLEVALL